MSEDASAFKSASELFAEPTHVSVMRRMRLLRPQDRAIAQRRVLIAILVGWVPLAVLCLLQGAIRHNDAIYSFFTDIGAYARYLVAAPAFILSEYIILPRLEAAAHYLATADLIASEDLPKYHQITESSRRLSAGIRTSVWMVLAVYGLIALVAFNAPRGTFPAWHHLDWALRFSLAGWWHMLISLPLLLGLMLGWFWRLGLWMRFLKAISRLHLKLVPAHPDGAGGLQFIALSPRLFMPLAFAFGAISAGTMANHVMHDGLNPMDHPFLPAITALVMVVMLVTPPLVFTSRLMHTWHRGIFFYGELARRMGLTFEDKWFSRNSVIDSETLEKPDFSSTTDLYGIVSNVYNMRPLLFDPKNAVTILVATLIPFAPVYLSVVPAKTVFQHLLGMLF